MVFPYYSVFEGGMRKRSRRTPNTSESTGKIGQELPSNQLRPLVPLYPDEVPAAVPAAVSEPRPARPDRRPRPESPAKQQQPARQEWNEPADSSRFELEDRKSTRLNSSHLGISYAV